MGKIISNGIEYTNPIGTTIVPNPEGSPTDELTSIQIGNDIYEIVGGGGSSGGDILIKDRDWILITSSFGTTQLTNTYDYYLWIVICNGKIDHYKIIDSSLLDLETNEDSIIEYKSWNDGQGAYSDSRVIITASSVTLWDNNQEAVSAKLYGANAQSGGGSASWKDITGTLTAGQTSITLIDSSILESSTFDFYTSKFGVNPTNISVLNGSITLTFDEQSTDLGVKVRITNDEESPYIFKEYLEASGNASIDTNVDISSTSYFELKGAFTQNTNNNNMYGLGYANKESNVLVASGTIYNQLASSSTANIPYDTNDHIFKANSNMLYIDSTTGTPNWNKVPTGNRIRLFATAYGGIFSNSRISYAKIYYCKMYSGEALIRDFVPAIRKSDNEIGMYDRVNDVFYTNDGTETFTTN